MQYFTSKNSESVISYNEQTDEAFVNYIDSTKKFVSEELSKPAKTILLNICQGDWQVADKRAMDKLLESTKTYKIGQLFEISHDLWKPKPETYILASVSYDTFNLINIKSGSRFCAESFPMENNKVTMDELKTIIHYSEDELKTIIRHDEFEVRAL